MAGSGTEALCPAIFITAVAGADPGNGAASFRTSHVGRGPLEGYVWAGAGEDFTPAADNLDGLVIGKDRPWFRGRGWILICSLLRLTVGNGLSCERRPAPRSFLGKKALSRIHPGS